VQTGQSYLKPVGFSAPDFKQLLCIDAVAVQQGLKLDGETFIISYISVPNNEQQSGSSQQIAPVP
jgi:hypothetical protein